MNVPLHDTLIWLGIAFCLSQSAMFSGLNLALLGISRLRLEVESSTGNKNAQKILYLRRDFNFLLTTILWGNVAINVLLTLLSHSVMAGITAFFFSTFLITLFGEIAPQAYFSRHAMKVGALLSPVLRFYQVLLYPIAKPCALILDSWLGKEGIRYFQEKDLREVIIKHVDFADSEVGHIEGTGALNFLALDDRPASEEGKELDPDSMITLPVKNGKPVFPAITRSSSDPFLLQVTKSGRKWVIIVDHEGQPIAVINANEFIRAVLFNEGNLNPYLYSRLPLVITNPSLTMGKVLPELHVHSESSAHDVIKNDVILVWSDQKRIITGADILGRLLCGIAKTDEE
jgi:hypothetical protein